MEVGLNETQELLQRNAREALKELCPPSLVRAAEADPSRASDLWRKFADLGWLGLPFAEAHGGAESDLLTLMVLVEELGYAAAPTPFLATIVQAGLTIADAGTPEQQADLLPGIIRGDVIASLAVSEPGPRFVRDHFQTTVRRSGDALQLTGAKSHVAYAGLARWFVVAAQDGADCALVLVAADDPGVTVQRQYSMADEPIGSVTLDVTLPAARLLSGGRSALDRALARAALGEVAYQVGAGEHAAEMATEYAKTRIQFGRPIGSFQAIAHKAADMAVELDGLRMLVRRAAWFYDEGLDFAGPVAMAKTWSGDAGKRLISNSHQIHGAIGFTTEYDLNLYTRRIKAHEFAFGRPEEHLAAVAGAAGVAVS